MNAEQKERALTALGMWRSSNDGSQREYQSAELMVALLQELIDAPEPEPVAKVTGYYGGYLSISTIDGRVLPACTALYLDPPVPSVPDGWMRAIDEAMVVHHIGIADRADSYEVAKKKLNALLILNQNIGEYFSAKAPVPSVPDGWKLVPYTPTEEMLEQAAYAVNSRPKPSKYEATATPSIIFWNAMLKYSPESTGIKEPPADLVRDAKPDIWRVMCGDWRDKTVAIHNSAGYITCGLDPAKAAVLVRAHNGEMSDGGAAIAEVKGQS